MIRFVKNSLEGLFAAPKNHPVTCANPKLWPIEEMKIDSNSMNGEDRKIYIRNRHSMWFPLSNCWIGTEKELLNELDLTPRDLEERKETFLQEGSVSK